MTGFGEAHCQQDGLAVSIEIRTINNRYFKLALKCTEGYSVLEPEIEQVVRQQIRRGTVQISLRVDRLKAADDYRINGSVLASYRQQIADLTRLWGRPEEPSLAMLLTLPGVVSERALGASEVVEEWPLVRRTLEEAMAHLARMRTDEGNAMASDLMANCRAIAGDLDEIQRRASGVVEGYRNRLLERVQALLSDYQVTLDPSDLIKEVSVFAERSDISEEIVRLRSHLEQFGGIMALPECSGRKLEFLTQEMFREINTIGSKANDVEIARYVIDVKANIERVREMIQNVE